MKPFQVSRAALLAATLAAVPLAGFAQGAANPPNATPPTVGSAETANPAARPAMPQAAAGRHETRVEERIADLHARLHITPAQETQWNQFAQVMRDNARNMDQTFEQRAQRFGQMTAVDNMQSYAQLAEAHAQDVQKLVPAFQAVYDSMSADQKRTADQLFRNYAEHGPHHGMGHHG